GIHSRGWAGGPPPRRKAAEAWAGKSAVIPPDSLGVSRFFARPHSHPRFRLTATKGWKWAVRISASADGLLHSAPLHEGCQPTFGNQTRTDRFGEPIKGERMILDVEDEDDFRFFIRSPRPGLEGHSGGEPFFERSFYERNAFLSVLGAGHVEINFV